MRSRATYDLDDILLHARFHPHRSHFGAALLNYSRVSQPGDLHVLQMPRVKSGIPAGDDLFFFRLLRIIDDDLHQKTVELSLGERVRALIFDRVFGRENRKDGRQRIAFAVDRRLAFLHRLEQGSLRLWRRAVYFVGKQDVSKYRPVPHTELRRLHIEYIRARYIRRHQIGCELNSRILSANDVSQRLNRQRLRRTGNALDQRMPLGQNRDQDLLDNIVLSDDRLATPWG